MNQKQICPSCLEEAEMTRDHIVPRWLRIRIQEFGMTHFDICNRAGLRPGLYERICHPCNLAKGGKIDYSVPEVQLYIATFIKMVAEQIRFAMRPRTLKVTCMCKTEPYSSPEAHDTIQDVKNIHSGGVYAIPKEPHEINRPSHFETLSAQRKSPL